MSCKLVILVSGNGSNLQALIDAEAAGTLNAQIALVLCNRPGAKALERAERAQIPTRCLPHKEYPSREAYDEALLDALAPLEADGIVLAGFDRILSAKFIQNYSHRILNIHPALLPAFPGMYGVQQALAYGAKMTGVTVHFVDDGSDTGPIILQEAVPIREDEPEEELLQRVHTVEHRLFPQAVRLFAEGRLKIDGRKVHIL